MPLNQWTHWSRATVDQRPGPARPGPGPGAPAKPRAPLGSRSPRGAWALGGSAATAEHRSAGQRGSADGRSLIVYDLHRRHLLPASRQLGASAHGQRRRRSRKVCTEAMPAAAGEGKRIYGLVCRSFLPRGAIDRSRLVAAHRASTASPYRPSLRGPIPAIASSSSVPRRPPLGERDQRGVGEDDVRRDLLRRRRPGRATPAAARSSSSSRSDGQVGQRPSLRSAPASSVAPQTRQETTCARRRSGFRLSAGRAAARSPPPPRSSCGRNRHGRRGPAARRAGLARTTARATAAPG